MHGRPPHWRGFEVIRFSNSELIDIDSAETLRPSAASLFQISSLANNLQGFKRRSQLGNAPRFVKTNTGFLSRQFDQRFRAEDPEY